MESESKKSRKAKQGIVISVKMDKTAVVLVKTLRKYPKYGKYTVVSKKYKVHDESNSLKEGDRVTIKECKPRSKEKRFELV